MIVLPNSCEFPDCTRRGEHRHHVVYYPKEVIKLLCRKHHEEITILNGIHARRVRHQLSNNHRWFLWYQWTAGELKPRRTRKALEYIEEWDRKPDPLPLVAPSVSEPIQEVPKKRRKSTPKKKARSVARPLTRKLVGIKRRSKK